MRMSAPPLLAVLRSRLQGEVLSTMYLDTRDRALSISEIARLLDEPVATVHREVVRLLDAGLLEETRVGRTRLIVAPQGNELVTRPLRDLLAVTFGPLPILQGEFAALDPIPAAFIYGSWAARYTGAPGPPPNDIDVLVVSDDADLDELDDLADRAGHTLRREVNVRTVSSDRWREPGADPFLSGVRDRPLIALTDVARTLIGDSDG